LEAGTGGVDNGRGCDYSRLAPAGPLVPPI